MSILGRPPVHCTGLLACIRKVTLKFEMYFLFIFIFKERCFYLYVEITY